MTDWLLPGIAGMSLYLQESDFTEVPIACALSKSLVPQSQWHLGTFDIILSD